MPRHGRGEELILICHCWRAWIALLPFVGWVDTFSKVSSCVACLRFLFFSTSHRYGGPYRALEMARDSDNEDVSS